MEYAQLNIALTEAIQITTHGNVEWDANNYCSAAALVKDGRAEQFRVVPLTATEAPTIDPLTQTVVRDGCEQVEGEWQYKWRVDALTAEQAAARKAGVIAQIAQLETASLMPRPVRVALLSILPADSLEHTKVLALEEEIQRLRVTLKEYDANTTIKQAD